MIGYLFKTSTIVDFLGIIVLADVLPWLIPSFLTLMVWAIFVYRLNSMDYLTAAYGFIMGLFITLVIWLIFMIAMYILK